ncbi:zinc ABC transporter substrate-binding protein [Immundisolibacter sp.]|uniref:metal ABC transporter substrate-binding protein n=1 Tax=Immundisolibacter sp. TaxID=1934948 RepID=UPI002639285E|nr:zinc ABC transporter substrate-binding protein [Immundisolibacter sp.]MDD3649925.1 zinc ABC transporter substrate-binding protein [Immundisolibacter sp.]
MRTLFLSALMSFLLIAPAQAALRVLTCEPEWAALTRELAGDLAEVDSATTALQDPHRIEARPSLLAKARRADLLVCTGAELEMGWLPLLQRQAGNGRIQPGQAGYFEASAQVMLLERPARLDRAQGDVHAAGNPHVQLDPRRVARIAAALAQRLAQLDAANASRYVERNADFQDRWQAAIARWEAQGARLKGVPVVVHHKSFTYLADWLGLVEVGDLEPKPGVEPSAAHLAELLDTLKVRPARMILRAAYQSAQPSEWLSQKAGIPAVELPFTVGGAPGTDDLFGLFDVTLARLLAAAP